MFQGLGKKAIALAMGVRGRNSSRERDGLALKLFRPGEEAVSGLLNPILFPSPGATGEGLGWEMTEEGATVGQKGALWSRGTAKKTKS